MHCSRGGGGWLSTRNTGFGAEESGPVLITKGLEIMVDSVECRDVELMAFSERHRANGPFLIMANDQISYGSGNRAWFCGVLFFHTAYFIHKFKVGCTPVLGIKLHKGVSTVHICLRSDKLSAT